MGAKTKMCENRWSIIIFQLLEHNYSLNQSLLSDTLLRTETTLALKALMIDRTCPPQMYSAVLDSSLPPTNWAD